MKTMFAAAALMASLALPGSAGAATVINGGFEMGPLGAGAPTGWQTNDGTLVQIVNSFSGSVGPNSFSYAAQEGSRFSVLTTGAANVPTALTQTLTLTAGQTISFMVAFIAGDYAPFNDFANISVINLSNFSIANIFTQSVSTQGDYSTGSWTKVSFTAANTGSYVISASVANGLDNANQSFLLLDAPAVPEPGAWMLMLLGLGAVGFSMRRRTNVRVSFA